MPRRVLPAAVRERLRRIPAAVSAVRTVRRYIDADVREIHRVRNAHAGEVFQPFTDTSDDRYPALFDAIAGRLAHIEAPRILSFGCSSGAEVRALRQRLPNARITGLDLNRRRIAEARARDGSPLSEYRRAGSVPSSERFDAVLALAVFRHGELEASRPPSCTSVLPFARFEAGVTMLDQSLSPGGLLAIWHAHFRFADTRVADRYDAVTVDMSDVGGQTLLYGRDDRRLDAGEEKRALFRKLR